MRVDARPSVVLRQLDHGGAYRVEPDAADDGQQVALALHHAGLEAALPQRAAVPVPDVECLHMGLADPVHGT
jgi:hypothetical protein